MEFNIKTSNATINNKLDNYDSLDVNEKQALLSALSHQLIRDGVPRETFIEVIDKIIEDIKEETA